MRPSANCWLVPPPSNRGLRGSAAATVALLFSLLGVEFTWAAEANGTRPLRQLSTDRLHTILPRGAHQLLEASAIEDFLHRLDDHPPDWATVYGHGHHDPGHDDRLVALNRERDAARSGQTAITWLVTFEWPGQLTSYDPRSAGFAVGIGPAFITTQWGVVRFKPDELPGNLTAIPDPQRRKVLRRRFEQGEQIEVRVVMTGRLIPEESLVYDFSHDQEGLGLIMPVVRIEQIDFVLPPRNH